RSVSSHSQLRVGEPTHAVATARFLIRLPPSRACRESNPNHRAFETLKDKCFRRDENLRGAPLSARRRTQNRRVVLPESPRLQLTVQGPACRSRTVGSLLALGKESGSSSPK